MRRRREARWRACSIPFVGGLVVLATLLPNEATAQEVEITPFVGFQSGARIDGREGDATIEPDLAYGLGLSFRVRSDGLVELLYSRHETTLEVERSSGVEHSLDLYDFRVETFHFGGLWEIQPGSRRPFLGLSVGATRFAPEGLGDEWAFSGGISGGVKIFFTDNVGLRLEGRGLLHFGPSEGGIFCSSAGTLTCAVTASGAGLIQVQALAGLVVAF